MATQSPDQSHRAKRPKPSITTHPAFAGIVALWFASLLGIGSLILPTALIEQAVLAIALPDLISATQPPLGFTARAAIAIAFTILGALLGLFAARQIARSNKDDAPGRAIKPADFARRQPVKAHEELGADGFDGNQGTRRRALAMTEEALPSEFFESAPLPSQTQQANVPLTDLDEESEPLELNEFSQNDAMSLPQDTAVPEPEHQAFDQMAAFAQSHTAESHSAESHTAEWPDADADADADETEAEFEAEVEEEIPGEPAQATQSQPLAFSPPSLALAASLAKEAGIEARHEDMPLADLGLVQLVQRLALTIEKHRVWNADREATQSSPIALAAAMPQAVPDEIDTDIPAQESAGFETAAANDVIEARAAYFSAPPHSPEQPSAEMAEPDRQEGADRQDGADRQEDADRQSFIPQPESFAPQAPGAIAPEAVGTDFSAPASGKFTDADETAGETADETADESGPLAQPRKLPASFTPATDGNDDDDDEAGENELAALAASFALPPAPKRKAAIVLPQGPEENSPANGSLDNLQNPFDKPAHEFIRVEDEPETESPQSAVVFPNEKSDLSANHAETISKLRAFDPPSAGMPASASHAQAAGAPSCPPKTTGDEADRALRDALMNLQRMGKAS